MTDDQIYPFQMPGEAHVVAVEEWRGLIYPRVVLHPDIQAQLDRIEQALCGDVKRKFQDQA